MKFHVLTLFPDMIEQVARTSIIGRALASEAISLEVINIRDFSVKKTKRVDDYPYGGGAGMVMEAEPVFRAVEKAKENAASGTRVIYLTPAAPVLTQTKVEELAKEEELILLCGHYEGIDERVLEECVTDHISIGDYVLTGGELGACVLMDAVSRFVPGVLSNEESAMFESLQDNLLEYPQYTRPEIWHDRTVPEVLLSGDHKKVEEWRHEQSLIRTKTRRPDLMEKSYRTSVLYFGSEQIAEYAAELAGTISRYAVLLDYDRNKLKKHKKRFGTKDLVLAVSDDTKKAAEAFEKVSADGAALAWITNEGEEKNRDWQDFFEDKGFSFLGSFGLSEDRDVLSLRIRKAIE